MSREFEPDRSHNPTVALAATWLALLLISGVPVVLLREQLPAAAVVVSLVVVGLVGVYCLVLAVGWRRMAYDVTPDQVVLHFEPLATYRLPTAQIEAIERVTPKETLFASHSWKGLVVLGVRYTGLGKVRMCATRASDVLLIRMRDGRLYGATPADEPGFLAAVTAHASL